MSLDSTLVDLARRTGRFKDWKPGERATLHTDVVSFQGDIPPRAGVERNQRRLVLADPPPLVTEADDILYTREGMAWVDGSLERRYSFEHVVARHVLRKPWRAARSVARGSVLQSETPYTYGDWMSEHVATLAQAQIDGQIVEPLLLPARWFAKPYVQRDLATMGVRAEAVDRTVRIGHATVLNKRRHSHFWCKPEVDAVMSAMRTVQRPCRPGSALYVSRAGQRSEGLQRSVDNEVTEAAMEASGVKVVRTTGLGPDDYRALADDAETLFFDHGSAGDNLMHWQTRRVVEFFRPASNYWDPSFLFLADCLGIHDYHLWCISPTLTVADLVARIAALRSLPFTAGSPHP